MFAIEPEGSFLTVRAQGASQEALSILERAHQLCQQLRDVPDDGRYWLPPGKLRALMKELALGARFNYDNKPLIVNFYSDVPIQNGKLRIRDDLIDPDQCDAVGRGWCLYRGCLRFLAEALPPLSEERRLEEVWPVLQLTDPRGAFANLVEGKEQWEADLLETDFMKKRVGNSEYYCPTDKVAKSLTFLLEVGWTIRDAAGRQVHRQTAMQADVNAEKQAFFVRGAARYEEHEVDLTQVVGAFNRRDRFVELGVGHVGLLPEGTPIQSLAASECIGDAVRIPKYKLGQLEPFLQQTGVRVEKVLRQPREVGCASRFCGSLWPYQQVGVNWLAYLYDQGLNGLLADDMGLGKTVQVIAFLAHLPQEASHLIVVPTSLLFNWQRELERFLPDQTITLFHGADRHHTELQGVVLTSYGTLRREAARFAQHPFCSCILDEAQAIKNPDSQVAQAACALSAPFRLSISGTPVENRSEELWAHFHFLMPDLLGDRQEFCAQVAASHSDGRHGQAISQAIRPFILRRTKEEVAPDLPPKLEQVVVLAMEEAQRAAYEEILASGQQIAELGSRMEVLERILRLRQLCCHPLLIGDENAPSAKFEALLADLEALVEQGRKVLVYSQFASMLQLIGRHLDFPHVLLTGATRNREELVERFQTEDELPIFLISLKAGGVGLNLTAADTVLLFDPWWNEAVENQAIDRAHRIGQDKTVIAKRYLLADTIEEKLMRLKAHKRALGEQLVDDTALTDTALRDLLLN